MNKEKWKIVRITVLFSLVLCLCVNILPNNLLANSGLSDEEQVIDNISGEDHTKLLSNEKNAQINSEKEDKTESNSEGNSVKPSEKEGKEAVNVIVNTNGWSNTEDQFNLSIAASVAANNTGNKIIVHLPQYIKLAAEITLGGELTKVEVSGNSEMVDGTTITMYFNDTTDKAVVMGKDIRISQGDFIKKSYISNYDIKVTFTDDKEQSVSNTQNLNPTINADKEITGELGIYMSDAKNKSEWIIPIFEYKYHVKFITGFNLDDNTSKGSIIIDKTVMKYFDWIGDPSFVQSDGSISYPINNTMYDSGGTTLEIDLPIKLNDSKRMELLSKQSKISFDISLEFDNGKAGELSDEYDVAYFTKGGYLYDEGISFVNLISGSFMGGGFSNLTLFQYTLAVNGKTGVFTNEEDDVYYKNWASFVNKYNIGFQMKLPDNVTWKGESKFYNSATRTLTLSYADNDNGYSIRNFRSSGSGGMSFGLLLNKLSSFDYSYNYNSSENETPSNLEFSDFKVCYQDPVSGDTKVLEDIGSWNTAVKYSVPPVNYKSLSTVFDETENIELFTIQLKSGASGTYVYPKFDFDVDFNSKDVSNVANSINDIFDVKEIRGIAPKDSSSNYIPIKVNLTTNKKVKEYTVEDADYSIELDENEVIQKIKVTPAVAKYQPAMDGSIQFIGNVNVKDKDNFFAKSESVPYTASGIGRWGTEKKGSTFAAEQKMQLISRTIKKFNKKSLDSKSSLGSYYPGNLNAASFTAVLSVPEDEFGVQKVVYELDEEFLTNKYLKMNAVSCTYSWLYFDASYTTSKQSLPVHKDNINSIILEDDEYFTSLSITVSKYTPMNFGVFLPLENAPDEITDIASLKIFKVKETDKISESYITGISGKLYHKIKLNISPLLVYNQVNNGAINLGNLNPGDEKELPLYLGVNGTTTSTAYPVPEKIYNPIFYVQIPDNFEYSGLSLKGSMQGKTPYTKIIQLTDGTRLVKVKFYGSTDSDTGYEDVLKAGDVSINIKVKEFAKAGEVKQQQQVNVFVDLSDWLDKLVEENKNIEIDYGNASTKFVTFYDSDSNETKKLVRSSSSSWYSYISYNILQNNTIKAGASVSLDENLIQKDNLTVRSGEEFNTFIDLYNNAGGPIDDFTMYIPVARKGKDNGDGSTWDWSAKLIKAGLDTTDVITVTYSTAPDPTMNKLDGKTDPDGMYQASVSDLSKVTMVKLSANGIDNATLITLKARISSLDKKTEAGNQKISVKGMYSYKFLGQSTYNKANTNEVTVTLADTSLKGVLFVDQNENGIMEESEERLPGKTVTLYDQRNNVIESVKSDNKGEYHFIKTSLDEDDYLKVDEIPGYVLTWQNKESGEKKTVSYFDKDTYRAAPTLKNAENLNAGFIEAPALIADPAEYTIRMKKTDTILYHISDGSARNVQFESNNKKIANVNSDGVITPVATGKTTVKVFYETASGIQVSVVVKVNIESNDSPVITAPDVVTMNTGDVWDAKDLAIIDGLALSDDHDNVDYHDLDVEDNVPTYGNFLLFFKNADTGTIKEAGTYKLKYSYTDDDGNTSEKIVTVKVHGQPVLENTRGEVLTEDTIPYIYFRVGESLNPFKDVKAFYDKASNVVGEAPVKTEILPDDTKNGIFTIQDPVDNDGHPVIGSPEKAGKYKGTYRIKTASEAKSTKEVLISRGLYAQGKIAFTGHNIAYPSSSDIHSFASWEAFYAKYKDKIQLTANLTTPNLDGSVETKSLLNTLKVIDPVSGHEIDFSTIDFSLPKNQTSKSITLKLRVYDDGKANWSPDGTAVYGATYSDLNIVIMVENYVGEVPHIHFNNINRVSNDEIRDITSSDPDKDLSTDESMAEAASKNEHPLRNRLMNDVTFSDADGSITEKNIVSIKRLPLIPDDSVRVDYDPEQEQEIKEMMTTVGIYKILYSTMDDDNNKISAERTVHISGSTTFVSNMTDYAVPPSVINVIASDRGYTPSGIFAYHLDYSEADKKLIKHETSVLPEVSTLDISKPGTYQVTYRTGHHFATYPDGTTARPADTFTQIIKVHGAITFNKENNKVENYFVSNQPDLRDIGAYFLKAQDSVGSKPVLTNLKLTNNLNEDKLHVSEVGSVNIVFSADASSESGISSHKATLNRRYDFYSDPIIMAPEKIRVKENITQDELKEAINASSILNGPDKTEKNLETTYDFTHMNDAEKPFVRLSASYTLSYNTNVATKDVCLIKIAQPTLQADNITYNVGDQFDVIKDSNLHGEYDGTAIDPADIQYDQSVVPVDADGNVLVPGTYQLTFAYEDAETHNKVTKSIYVNVNGLPVFHEISDLIKRTGDDIDVWQTAYITWLKASNDGGAAIENRFTYATAAEKGAKFDLQDMKNELTGTAVDFGALNTAGYYSGVYYAETPTGGQNTQKHTLLLHGKPTIESASSITISKNVKKPADFLAEFNDELGIKASVMRAYTDKNAQTVDLTDEVIANTDDLNSIKYGEIGSYEVKLSVTDTVNVPGSKYNTVTKSIIVNIVDLNGTAPVITTPISVQRVEDDQIGLNDVSDGNIADYLLNKAVYKDVEGNRIKNKEILSVKKTAGPEANTIKVINNPNNADLKKIMNTVGEYQAVLKIADEKANIVTAALKIEVAGKTEFGYDQNGKFMKLNEILNVRQSDLTYDFDGIYARHMDPGGTYDKVGINKSANVDISSVSVKKLKITAQHHYAYYDDDPTRLREVDSHEYKLLVQGKIIFHNVEDMYTRVNSTVDPLKTVIDKDTIKDIYASFDMIDTDGNKHEENITPSAENIDTTKPSVQNITITAVDNVSMASHKTETIKRKIYVSSLPVINFKNEFNVNSETELKELINGAKISATYMNSSNQTMSVAEGDIDIGYKNTLNQIKSGPTGREYPLEIKIRYLDNNIEKTISETAHVYVLNDPGVIVRIPSQLDMKDDGSGSISTRADIELYESSDKDSRKDKVPAVKIYVDPDVTMKKGDDEFTAQAYKKDRVTKYVDAADPIMKLQYGHQEDDYFYLKTDKADVSKEIGLYQGILNIIMEYEGD